MTFRIDFQLSIKIILICFACNLPAQKLFYGETPVNWQNYTKVLPGPDISKYDNSDLVIVNDETEFSFYASNNEKITRNITIKINSEKGLEFLKSFTLPQSFDPAFDAHYYKQGRQSRIKTPFIKEFRIEKFSARKFSANRWTDVSFKLDYENIKWIRSSGSFAGEFMKEDLNVFHLQDLNVGDVVQIVYQSAFSSNYGSNIFYLHASWPKMHCKYTFTYKVQKQLAGASFLFIKNIKDSLVKKEITNYKDYDIVTTRLESYNLAGINYPANSFEGNRLPHVFADFRVFRVLTGSYPESDGFRIHDYMVYRPANFEWIAFGDTANNFTKVYDKQFASIRKFMTRLPPIIGADSTTKDFVKALCDTLNSFRYLSDNQMFYNESNLRDVYSGDHLLKRRLVENLQWKLYTDILNENKTFYSIVNIQDNRYGEHTPMYRAAYAYEAKLIAIPHKNSYIYFMPRYNGIKYHLNELPFYYEGSLAALTPMNFQADTKNKEAHFFKFIRTHTGTYNENSRVENAQVRIVLDSLKADLTIKENLGGQFSTILRHLYLHESIDSTIAPYYFKKCVDKPFASDIKIKLSSKMTEYPFRYNFACTEKLGLVGDKQLKMKNWFSFLLSKNSIPEKPNHTYFFDFAYSDTYNFVLNFKESIQLKNASAFTKKINNEYFELESEIVPNSDNTYLVKVRVAVKKLSIPYEKTDLLMELVKELDDLNDFSLQLER